MAAELALSAVSAAIFAQLNVPAVTDLATGGVDDGYVRGRTGARVWFEVQERNIGGFGGGSLPEVEVRVHVLVPTDVYRGMKLAQDIGAAVIGRLRNAALAFAGYASCGRVLYEDTIPLAGEVVEGVVVTELVAMFRLWVEAV